MNKIKNFTIIFILTFISIYIIINNNDIKNVIFFSYVIFVENLFPNMFPFFILSELLINYNFIKILANIFSKFFIYIFHVSPNCAYIFLMSIITGFPSSAKNTKDLLDKKIISIEEANKVIMYTHFSNPLFIIGLLSQISFKFALTVLFSHYIGNLILAVIFRPKKYINNTNNYIIEQKTFGESLSCAIKNSINTLLLIFGTVTFFLIITYIFNDILNINGIIKVIINGFFEITQGIKYTLLFNISNKIKGLLITMFISFGGICIHFQILSIISNTKIKYFNFLKARILHSIISGLLYLIII